MTDVLPSTPQLDNLTQNLLSKALHQTFEPDQHPHRHNQLQNQSLNLSINQFLAHTIKHNRLIDSAQFFYRLVQAIETEIITNQSNNLVNQSMYLLHHQNHLSNLLNCLSMIGDDAVAYQAISQSSKLSNNDTILIVNPLITHNKLQISLAYSELIKQSISQSTSPVVTFNQAIDQPLNLIGPMLRVNLFTRALRLIDCLINQKQRIQGLKLIVDCLIDCLIDCWKFEHEWISERSGRCLIDLDEPAVLTLLINQSINPRISSKSRFTSSHYSEMLSIIFDRYDQSINQLRPYAIEKLLQSPMKLAVPLSFINQSIKQSIESDDDSEHEDNQSMNDDDQSIKQTNNQSINQSSSFVPVLRVLMKENRLDLAVWLTVEHLSQRLNNQSNKQSINQTINQSNSKSQTDGVEWNVLDDLLARLDQLKSHPSLDQSMKNQINQWHQQLTEALTQYFQQ